jgi:hypothetical protein
MVLFGTPYHRVFGNNSDVLPNVSIHYWYIRVRTTSVIESHPVEEFGIIFFF